MPALFAPNALSVKIDPRAGQSRVSPKRPLVNFSDSMRMKKLLQGLVPICAQAALRERQGLLNLPSSRWNAEMTSALFVLNALSVKIDPRACQSRVSSKRRLVNFSDSLSMEKLVQRPVSICAPAARTERQGL